MKFTSTLVTIVAWLLCLIASETIQYKFPNASLLNYSAPAIGFDEQTAQTAATKEELWNRVTCRGIKLLFCTTLNPTEAALHCSPLTTPWRGTLEAALRMWGYKDDSNAPNREGYCDFDATYNMKTAFRDLGIDTRDFLEGGPNRCFTVLHFDGPAVVRNPDGSLPRERNQYYMVNGRRYRVTGAYFTIGINGQDGYVYFLNRVSPEHQAHFLWDIPPDAPIPRDALPALKSSSDIAWGFWNRMSPNNLGNIKGFLSVTVVNDDTMAAIDMALARRGYNSLPRWPGVQFDSGTEEYNAILGTPNGLAAGYFLAQHKEEIGGNKYVSRIIAFKEDGDPNGFPNLLFKVDWAPNPPPPPPPPPGNLHARSVAGDAIYQWNTCPNNMKNGKVLESSSDGRRIIREHTIWAN